MAARISHVQYTIGWATILPVEIEAARLMLSELHDEPEGFVRDLCDRNRYVFGRISNYNIVIALLHTEVPETAPKAMTARLMRKAFPSIDTCLMVGIGGGIPCLSDDADIRLGDIAVSMGSSSYPPIVQYDIGELQAGGEITHKPVYHSPCIQLIRAVGTLRSKHVRREPDFPKILDAMIEKNEENLQMSRLDPSYTYQGMKNDRLFLSTYTHTGGSNCHECDVRAEMPRQEIESANPDVYYCTIASGDMALEDSVLRDAIYEDLEGECFCIEIGAAEVMDEFPCLVIRGISDYADSHKNDRWQRYAAGMAAAYAKELLSVMSELR